MSSTEKPSVTQKNTTSTSSPTNSTTQSSKPEIIEPLTITSTSSNTPSKAHSPATKPTKQKKCLGFKLFGIGLTCATLGFGYVVADYFYFEPMRNAGKPVYGTRLDHLSPLDPTILETVQAQALNTEGIQSAQLHVQGEVIYLSLTTNSLSLDEAQKVAEKTAKTFVQKAGDSFKNYNLQLMVTTPNLDELLTSNRDAEDLHVKNHKVGIIETIIAHTEKYPTAENMQRSQANINILKKSYPEEAEAFQARIEALKEYTAEEEAALNIPALTVDQTVPTSNLSDFPSWGVYSIETSKTQWY